MYAGQRKTSCVFTVLCHCTAVCWVIANPLVGSVTLSWAKSCSQANTHTHTCTQRTTVSFYFGLGFLLLFYSQCYLAAVILRQATPSFHPACSLRKRLSGEGFEQLLLSREWNSDCWRGRRKGATNNICLKSGRGILIRWIIEWIIRIAPQSAIGQESP